MPLVSQTYTQRRRIMRTVPFIVSVAVMAACSSVFGPSGLRSEMERARKQWRDQAIANYTIEVQRICFCPNISPVRVTVVNGKIAAQTDSAGVPIPAASWNQHPDIEGLFAVILDALDRKAASVNIAYEPSLGYPIDVTIDYVTQAADDELGFRVRNFTRTP